LRILRLPAHISRRNPLRCLIVFIKTFPMTSFQHQQRSRIIVAFALLYVLWGSTYLAMRVIVRDMPPYVAGTVRYLIAGPIMLAALALTGRKVSITGSDLRRLLVIAILLLSTANIGV